MATALPGISDLTWGNDSCPSFGWTWADHTMLLVWVEHVDPDRRESAGFPRFCVQVVADDDIVDLVTSNDPDVAVAAAAYALALLEQPQVTA